MALHPEHPLLQRVVDDLAEHGWSRQSIFLPPDLTGDLAAECRRRHRQGELEQAGIGRGDAQVVRSIRGDRIAWLHADDAHPGVQRYLHLMDTLREAFNRGLFLGLEDYESHFALYPPGAFYARHLDRFRDDDRRMVSLVLYLNEGWLANEGGELRLYLPDDRQQDVLPLGGSLVCFLSGQMPHEVLPAVRERLSLTGWFRRRGDNPLHA